MSGITPYSPEVGNAADRCLDVAVDVGARLGELRRHLTSLDRVGMAALPAGRLQDLLVSYDVYVRMLHDALHDIARDLRATQRSDVELVGGDLR